MNRSFRTGLYAIVLLCIFSACSSTPAPTDAITGTLSPSPTTKITKIPSPSATATRTLPETGAPGDFPLDSIVKHAEEHMGNLVFSEIPTDELKELYPDIMALPVEVRGRRAADGTEYLVLSSTNKRDLDRIPNVREILTAAAKTRADALDMESAVTSNGFNKYGAVVCAKKDAIDILRVIDNTFTGQYIFN